MCVDSEMVYQEEVKERESNDYSPYSYVEDSEDPVFSDEETLSEWEWE